MMHLMMMIMIMMMIILNNIHIIGIIVDVVPGDGGKGQGFPWLHKNPAKMDGTQLLQQRLDQVPRPHADAT